MYVIALARGLAERGHTCFVGAPPGSATFEAAVAAPGIREIPFDLGPRLGHRSALDLALHWRSYRRLMRGFLENVVSAHDIDIMHAQFKKEQLLATVAAADMGLPVIWTEHGPLPGLFVRAPLALRRYTRNADRVSRILCVSDHVRTSLAAHGVSGPNVQLCYNGVAIPRATGQVERASARAGLGLEPHHFAVGCTARLVPSKGQRFLLEAAAAARHRIPGLRVLLVGDGPERASLELFAHQLDLEGIAAFFGTRDDARALLPAFDVFVAPSLGGGLPLAVLEAMAAERPVVGTRVGGIPEALADGAAGVLVDAGRTRPLEAALDRLFEQPRLRGELGATARKRVVDTFSLDAMLDATERAFVEAGGAPAAPAEAAIAI